MGNKYLFTLLLASAALSAGAKDITPQRAQSIAAKYVNIGKSPSRAAKIFKAPSSANGQSPDFYAFNDASGKGFVVVAGDDCVPAVLGYSHNGTFSSDNMAPQLRSWLDNVSRYIVAQRAAHGGEAKAYAPDDDSDDTEPTEIVKPLIKTQWSQEAPYYDMTPTVDGQQSLSGCVATATAQIMNYYKWPKSGTGSVDYDTPDYDQKHVSIDFSQSVYDWDHMLDRYNKKWNSDKGDYVNEWSETEGNAVALLMRDLGAALHMDYSPSESGAFGSDVAFVAANNFGYTTEYYFYEQFGSPKQWVDMLKSKLDAGIPLYYDGVSYKGHTYAHAFVVDGYDSNDYLHVNWGWSGADDGYWTFPDFGHYGYSYYMSAVSMKPNVSGVKSDFQYTFGSDLYIVNDGEDVINSQEVNINDVGKLSLLGAYYFDSNFRSYTGVVRVVLKDVNKNIVATLAQNDNVKFTSDGSVIPLSLKPQMFSQLADGTYKVSVEGREYRDNGTLFDEWLMARSFKQTCIVVTKSGDKLTFSSVKKYNSPMKVTKFDFKLSKENAKMQLNEPVALKYSLKSTDGGYNSGEEICLAVENIDSGKTVYLSLDTCSVWGTNSSDKNAEMVLTSRWGFGPGKQRLYLVSKKEGDNGEDIYEKLPSDVAPCEIEIVDNPDNYSILQGNDECGLVIAHKNMLGFPWPDAEQPEKKNNVYYISRDDAKYLCANVVFVETDNMDEYFNFLNVYSTLECNGKEIVCGQDDQASHKSTWFRLNSDAIAAMTSDELLGKVQTIRFMIQQVNTFDYAPLLYADGKPVEVFVCITDDATSIAGHTASGKPATVVGRYGLDGRRINGAQRGVNIVKMSDGTVRKVIVK